MTIRFMVGSNCDLPSSHLTFTPASGTVTITGNYLYLGNYEYSTDAVTWTRWDGSAITGNQLHIRGIGRNPVDGYSGIQFSSIEGQAVSCTGNIESILNWQMVSLGRHPAMKSNCFGSTFRNCVNLVSAPSLPATSLSSMCYWGMFQGCTSLTSAPTLPATTLADSCYMEMFQGCSSLASAPALPATTLAAYCYVRMFQECSSLASAPSLPATTLEASCYEMMFSECYRLASAPSLPATTLADSCYEDMFFRCNSLRNIPSIGATYFPYRSCREMFYISDLKFSTTQTSQCPNPYRLPTTGTGTVYDYDVFYKMFSGEYSSFTPSVNTTFYINKTVI